MTALHLASLAALALLLQEATATAPSYCDFFGRSVIVAGDLDGDEISDLVVSAPGQALEGAEFTGAVLAFSGADGSQLYRRWGSTAGRLAAVGDVDGDGAEDFLWTRIGDVTLRSGKDGALLRSHRLRAWTWDGHDEQVAGLGDVDGDGVPDYAVSDRGGKSDRGQVRLYSGESGELLRELEGDADGDWFGYALSGGMDVDGDGVPDLLVGAPRGNASDDSRRPVEGYARVHSGADGSVILRVEGGCWYDGFGQTVALLGDLDEDGRADFAVGAPAVPPESAGASPCPSSGYVRVFSGADGAVLRTLVANGKDCAFDCQFGYSLASAGDVDADGVADLMVGARRENASGGSARVFSGKTGEVLLERVGLPFRDWGHLVGGLGDVDGDGHADVFHVGLNDSQGARSIGHVMLVSGKTGELIRRLTSPLRPEGAEER